MSRVFVFADPHFGHAKVAEVRGFASVEEHDRALVEAWNRVVTKRDVVYLLGDVFRLDHVAELHGTKKLALGNHDTRTISVYAELFSKVGAYFELDGCLLSHIPVHESQFARWGLNLHGHTHRKVYDDRRYVNVSAEQCPRWEPMQIRELIQARRNELAAVALRAGEIAMTPPLPLNARRMETR